MSLSLGTTINTTPNSHQKPRFPHSIPSAFTPKRSSYTSCNQNQVPDQENTSIDRRNVLIGTMGLGTLYGASPMFGNTAFAKPIQPPDLLKGCHEAWDPQAEKKFTCCKPETTNAVDFTLPDPPKTLRVRRPAHKVDNDYIAKYKLAITKMKDLGEDDPMNFMQQAQIHCAFCNEAYDQVGYPGLPIQVHGSWLFPAWHRFYIYFWEKNIQNILGDPTFSIPYWDWADPKGMRLPNMYLDESSSLYNKNRNLDHYDALLDFKYAYNDPNPTPSQQQDVIQKNLKLLNTDFIESKKDPINFMGRILTAGDKDFKEQFGALETVHNTIHMWVGPTASPQWDMGNLHTAARDTIFFGHHANVDRLWNVYQIYRDKVEFDTPDWLDATFVFPDPDVKGQVLKCKVRDSLDPTKLGYTYESVNPDDQQFMKVRESYVKQKKSTRMKRSVAPLNAVSEFGTKPRTLTTTIRTLVKRPKAARTKDEKEGASEVLVIDDIDYDDKVHGRFDVYIAKPTADGKVSSDLGELAGSYVKIPNSHGKKPKNFKKFGITNLLEDIDAEESDSLVVSFVPRLGEQTVGGVSIELVEAR